MEINRSDISNSKDIYFYGTLVIPAQISESQDNIFTSSRLSFSKPRWVPDDDATVCYNCALKFSAMRRKHHCRQCGRVFCSQCCSHKAFLQHLSYQLAERVCSLCKSFVSLLLKAQSSDLTQKLEAARGFNELCRDTRTIISFVEMGGVIALVYVAKEREANISNVFLKAAHSLAQHSTLHLYMANAGFFKLITRILIDSDKSQSQLLCDAIYLLQMLCSSESVSLLAVKEGCIDALLTMCNSDFGPACLSALECLKTVSVCSVVFTAIVDNSHSHTLAKLLKLSVSPNEKVQEITLKILAQISSGSETHRQRLVEEDLYNGGQLVDILMSRQMKKNVLQNGVCLIANLAVDEKSQGALVHHLDEICKLLDAVDANEIEILRHIARGLSNFANFRNNCDILIHNLKSIVEKLMRSNDDQVRHYSCQIIVALLAYHTESCAEIMQSVGATEFLEYLGYNTSVIVAVRTSLNLSKFPAVI